MIKVLGDQRVFQQIPHIMMQLGTSRCQNLPGKAERMRRLVSSVYHLSVETLVLMPAFGCNVLGRDFYDDLLAVKNFPSVRSLQLPDSAFDLLLEGIPRLQININIFE